MKIKKIVINELIKLIIVGIIILIILKIVFYKESMTTILIASLGIFYLFALPGYFIMLYWREKIDFIERIVIGTGIAAGLLGIISFLLGVFNINLFIVGYIYPIMIILISIILNFKKNIENEEDMTESKLKSD